MRSIYQRHPPWSTGSCGEDGPTCGHLGLVTQERGYTHSVTEVRGGPRNTDISAELLKRLQISVKNDKDSTRAAIKTLWET